MPFSRVQYFPSLPSTYTYTTKLSYLIFLEVLSFLIRTAGLSILLLSLLDHLLLLPQRQLL